MEQQRPTFHPATLYLAMFACKVLCPSAMAFTVMAVISACSCWKAKFSTLNLKAAAEVNGLFCTPGEKLTKRCGKPWKTYGFPRKMLYTWWVFRIEVSVYPRRWKTTSKSRASQGRNWWLGLHILATVFCQKNVPPIIEKQVVVSTPLKNN